MSERPGAVAIEALLAGVATRYEEACAVSTVQQHDMDLAGSVVRIEVCGAGMAATLAPYAHLPAPPAGSEPVLVVRVFAGGEAPVPTPWLDGSYAPGADLRFADERWSLVYARTGSELNVIDRATRVAHWWIRDAVAPSWQQAALPFRLVLSWWLADRGQQLVHAGGVGDEQGALLLAARGGSGKSTAVLSCMLHGMRVLGDDFCIVDPAAGTASSAYSSATVNPDTLARLPELAGAVRRRPAAADDKVVLALWPEHASSLLPRAPVQALVVPRVGDGPSTRFERCSPMEALSAIVPVSVLTVNGNGPPALARFARLARQVPAYRLDVGNDPAGICDAVQRLLQASR